MKKSRKLSKKELLKFEGKRAIITKITQIINNDFIDFFVVKINGIVFCDDDGEYRWPTREEAKKARDRIKRRIRKVIDELKVA